MALPVRHRDLLLDFYSDTRRAKWARDLVGKIILTDGILKPNDLEIILNEILSPPASLSVNLSAFSDSPYPKIEISKLTHNRGIKALAENQTIDFCNEGHTYLFGQNGSGKSSYFRILNELAKGSQSYSLDGNVFAGASNPKSATIEYMVNGAPVIFAWDCIAPPPIELNHLRLFDSQYANRYLLSRGGNEYIFTSYHLQRFASLAEAVFELKSLDAPMGAEESFLEILYNNTYRNNLVSALQTQFKEELAKLGMDYLNVSLEINDLLKSSAEIRIIIDNTHDINNILSEAEKKCAALALFFAEYELLEVKQPLIFDDPVNSLDNQVIQFFAEKLSTINGQVILFTHSAQLLALLKEKDNQELKIYKDSSIVRTSSKIHALIYDIIANSPHDPGFVVSHMDLKSKHYIDKADAYMASNPVMLDTRPLVDYLRIALEWMIDEVVFYNQQPIVYRGKGKIPWSNLIKMTQFDSVKVQEMQSLYRSLSNSGSHVGYGSVFNPLTRAELIAIKSQIEAIRQIVYP